MRRTETLSIPLAAAVAALFALSCGEDPTSVAEIGDPQFHHREGHDGGPPGGGGGGDDDGGGGGTSPVDVRFVQERTADIASAEVQTLDGENSDERIQVDGPYTLTYSVDQTQCPDLSDGDFDLIKKFNGTALSGNAEITADKKEDADGGFEINDRVRVRLSDIDIGDGFRYSMRFLGKPTNENSTFDPVEDVTINELDHDGDGTPDETQVIVDEQELEVRQHHRRGNRILDTDVCFGVAFYTFYATR